MAGPSLLVVLFGLALAWFRMQRKPGAGVSSPRNRVSPILTAAAVLLFTVLLASSAVASEAELKIPDLSTVSFLGMNGHNLLLWGLLICVLGRRCPTPRRTGPYPPLGGPSM